MAFALLGEILVLGIALKAYKNIDGVPHKLKKTYKHKDSAQKYAQNLRSKGNKVRVVTKKDSNGKPFFIVYTKVESKKKVKKK